MEGMNIKEGNQHTVKTSALPTNTCISGFSSLFSLKHRAFTNNVSMVVIIPAQLEASFGCFSFVCSSYKSYFHIYSPFFKIERKEQKRTIRGGNITEFKDGSVDL